MLIIMSVLGAVVMPHNLFLHSEVVQSREYNKEDEQAIKKHLKYEFYDTLLSMGIGWAINSAMILLAATTFFVHGTPVEELQQAKSLLDPLLGKSGWRYFCTGSAHGWYFIYCYQWYGSRFYFCRYLWRIL